MKTTALVIVDAWHDWKTEQLPYTLLREEAHSFGTYLNTVCRFIKIKQKGTSIFHVSPRPIMDTIDTSEHTIVTDVLTIPKTFDYYYFCGFHYNVCVYKQAHIYAQSFKKIHNRYRIRIATNLCIMHPEDDLKKLPKDYFNNEIKNYYWTRQGFFPIELNRR